MNSIILNTSVNTAHAPLKMCTNKQCTSKDRDHVTEEPNGLFPFFHRVVADRINNNK